MGINDSEMDIGFGKMMQLLSKPDFLDKMMAGLESLDFEQIARIEQKVDDLQNAFNKVLNKMDELIKK